MNTSDRKRKETEEEAEERAKVERAKKEEAIKASEPEQVAPPTPLFEEANPLGHDQSSMDAEEDVAIPPGGKGSSASSSSTSGTRPGPYSSPKKTRFQSEAPDDMQLAVDIAAALAKDKEASNTLPAPASIGNINEVDPAAAAAAAAAAGAGADDAAAANMAPTTPPTLG